MNQVPNVWGFITWTSDSERSTEVVCWTLTSVPVPRVLISSSVTPV